MTSSTVLLIKEEQSEDSKKSWLKRNTLLPWAFFGGGFFGGFLFFGGGGGFGGFFVLWLWRFFVFQNAVPAINLIFKVSHKEHVHIYQDGIYTIQLSSRNQIENTQKYNKHCKHHFQGICLFLVYKQRHPIFLFMSYKSSWI